MTQVPTPTPTPIPSPTPTPSVTPSPSPTPIITPTPIPTPTPMITPTPLPTPTPAIAGTFVFAGSHGAERQSGGTISGFRRAHDGSLVPVPGSPFKTERGVTVIKSDPQGRFVFIGEGRAAAGARRAGCADEPGVLAVDKVDPASGALTHVESVTLRGSCVRDIAIDPSGKHLYVGVKNIATSGGSIQEFSISPTGALMEVAGSPVIVDEVPVSLAMHPSGRFIFAATPEVSILDRNSTTGALTVRSVFSTPKRQLALNSTGTLLIARERDTNEISEFQLDAGGNVIAETRQPAAPRFAVATDPLVTVVQPRY